MSVDQCVEQWIPDDKKLTSFIAYLHRSLEMNLPLLVSFRILPVDNDSHLSVDLQLRQE
ncbi:protein of unknown function [Shewanella benthica]|uniref:Uncharacterized protein n=1 Tax=Shewanella benthica TaxID=43661 RepID=A0A330M3D7_9GAMM|nr:protein of unknown function [Shewanella benthica]